MTPRTDRLRRESLDTPPAISAERATLITRFFKENEGKYSIPVLRARSFLHLCQNKTIYIGAEELIVGERGPRPKAVPTYPELTCHSLEDLKILNSRPMTHYNVDAVCLQAYEQEVISYWRGRSMRDKIFQVMTAEWKDAYDAGLFTEFMEQRAPGHTVLDDKIYRKGMLEFKKDIQKSLDSLDFMKDPAAFDKSEQLQAMSLSCDAVILFASRHAKLAREMAAVEKNEARQKELLKIAATCEWVPANAPRDFQEALQYYWFCHLAVITELNGWDSFNPGHLDQHLLPFFKKGIEDQTLTRESAKELLETFFIKFNNHPAPPKVGVTAAESGTYTDFANINIGGLLRDGSNGTNDVSHILLDIVDEMHLLQPSTNIQLSRKNPDTFLKHALKVIRQGYGFPSIFNADVVVEEQLRQGKTIEDARAGGCSGCVEVGAFGKEAYILTGYFNLVKILELTLHDGVDSRTGKQLGLKTGSADAFKTFDALFAAYVKQLHHFLEIKIRGNLVIERMYATLMPAPFLSVITDDCIKKGLDYNAGGARYNNTFIQLVGIGTITDSFAAIQKLVFSENLPANQSSSLTDLVKALDADFNGFDSFRQRLLHRMPKYGNDNDEADDIMRRIFQVCFDAVDNRPDNRGGRYRIEMLPTTCHVYFGSVTGATPDGRKATMPVSEGISPVQGADRNGPTAVLKSAAKMDHAKTGGTLLNMKFSPTLLNSDNAVDKWAGLVRSYFKLGGHHIQFNVFNVKTLRQAQTKPEAHRDLIVRVAGYSDYFCDLSKELQEEIIARTEHEGF